MHWRNFFIKAVLIGVLPLFWSGCWSSSLETFKNESASPAGVLLESILPNNVDWVVAVDLRDNHGWTDLNNHLSKIIGQARLYRLFSNDLVLTLKRYNLEEQKINELLGHSRFVLASRNGVYYSAFTLARAEDFQYFDTHLTKGPFKLENGIYRYPQDQVYLTLLQDTVVMTSSLESLENLRARSQNRPTDSLLEQDRFKNMWNRLAPHHLAYFFCQNNCGPIPEINLVITSQPDQVQTAYYLKTGSATTLPPSDYIQKIPSDPMVVTDLNGLTAWNKVFGWNVPAYLTGFLDLEYRPNLIPEIIAYSPQSPTDYNRLDLQIRHVVNTYRQNNPDYAKLLTLTKTDTERQVSIKIADLLSVYPGELSAYAKSLLLSNNWDFRYGYQNNQFFLTTRSTETTGTPRGHWNERLPELGNRHTGILYLDFDYLKQYLTYLNNLVNSIQPLSSKDQTAFNKITNLLANWQYFGGYYDLADDTITGSFTLHYAPVAKN